MTGEELLYALNFVEDDLVEAAEKDQPEKTGRPGLRLRYKVLAAVACLCLAVGGAVQVLLRLDYLKIGCSAWPGTIVDGSYYYNVPHSGVWRYTPGEGSEQLLSAFWEEGWQVNESGVYYVRGRSIYLQSHADGKTRRLYTVPLLQSTHIGFSFAADGMREGALAVTLYDRRKQQSREVLIDGQTGALVRELTGWQPYGSRGDVPYGWRFYPLEEQTLELTRHWSAQEEGFVGYDLLLNGQSVLPQGMYAVQYPRRYGPNLLVRAAQEGGAQAAEWQFLISAGGEAARLPDHAYSAGITGALFYTDDTGRVWCYLTDRKESRLLAADAAISVYEMTTDGEYLYTCVPWGDAQTCWRVGYDAKGLPETLTLVCADLRAARAG